MFFQRTPQEAALYDHRFINGYFKYGFRQMLRLSIALLITLSSLSCPASDQTPVVLQLDRALHFQHAGYYAALAKGFYREAGLAVEIHPGNEEVDAVEAVLSGAADFGIDDTSLLLRYDDGQEVVALSALFQHSPGALVTLESSGIQNLNDLVGQRVMIAPSFLPLMLAELKHAGVPPEALRIVPYSGRLEDLLEGKVDVLTVNLVNDIPELLSKNMRYRIIRPVAAEADFYGDCLFTMRARLNSNPEMVERFLEASWRGWRYTFQNPREITKLLHEKYGAKGSPSRLLEELAAARPLIRPDQVDIGYMTAARWQEIARVYSTAGLLPANFSVTGFVYNPVHREQEKLQYFKKWSIAAGGGLFALLLLLLGYLCLLRRSLRRGQQELYQNQARLEIALGTSGDGIWEWNFSSDRFFFNPQWVWAMGYRKENFPTTFSGWVHILHPEDQGLALHSANAARKDGDAIDLECRMRAGDGTWRWLLLRGKPQKGHRSHNIAGTCVDITHNKKVAEELHNRLHALTSPAHGAEDLAFHDIFDVASIQALQDGFAELFGVASLIIAPDGRPLTQPTSFTRLCSQIIRGNETGQALCAKTGQRLGTARDNEISVVTCQACGLLDGGAGIYAGDKHLANWLVGQVLPREYNLEEQTALAVRCGARPEEFRAAMAEVPRMSRERFTKICSVLNLFARQLSQLAWQNVAQGKVICDLNAAEEKLLENEALLKEAQAIAHVGHWSYRVLEDFFDCSEEARRILGLQRTGRLELAALRNVLHEDDRAKYDLLWQQSLQTGEALKANLRVVVAQTVRHIYLRGVILGGTSGKPEYFLGILQDISERVEREKVLREQEENLRITLDSIADGVIVADYAGHITRMNPVAQELTGWNIMEAKGQPLTAIFHTADPQTRQPCPGPAERVLHDGVQSGQPTELLLLARDESARTVSCSASPIRNERGVLVGVVLVLRDMTGRRRLEEQLRQAQKLEAIGQLAGGVAHDFNNLLGGIMGFAELLKISAAENDKTFHYASQIMTTAERAAQLTSQLLTFARKGQLPSTPFDVHETINEAVSILQHSIDRRIDIIVNCTAPRHSITGDPLQIQNAVLNLGINARDAMPEGGKLEISTVNIHLNREFCEASAFELEPGEFLQLTVRDSGCGIATEDLPRIFDPFFTTKQVGKGTGLGLAAVFGTVTAHGGAIDVRSGAEQGTEFRIFLPILSNEQEAREELPASEIERVGEGKTVLVIDDEPVIRLMAEQLLAEAGFTVLTAENGQEGVRIFQEHSAQINVVVVDMVMPVQDGLQTMRELRGLDPAVQVIAASGFSQNERIDQMLKEGARDFIHKPYNLHEIIAKIAPLL